MKRVLFITGLSGSGKTTASLFFQNNRIPVLSLGDITYETMKSKDLEPSEANEKRIRDMLRKKYGEMAYAKAIFPKIQTLLENHELIVIEGLRSNAEYAYFSRHLRDLKMMYIDSDDELRFQWLTKRKVRPLSKDELKKRDNWEKNILHLPNLKEKADWVVANRGTKQALFDKLKTILTELTEI